MGTVDREVEHGESWHQVILLLLHTMLRVRAAGHTTDPAAARNSTAFACRAHLGSRCQNPGLDQIAISLQVRLCQSDFCLQGRHILPRVSRIE